MPVLSSDPLAPASRFLMAPGVLAQSTLFVAIFYGISLIWERDLAFLLAALVVLVALAARLYPRAVA